MSPQLKKHLASDRSSRAAYDTDFAAMNHAAEDPKPARAWRRPEFLLLVLFLVSMPLVNPWIRGDGVGYYAYVRALLVQHNLDFTADYQHANTAFRELRLDRNGQPLPEFRTSTGHLDNHFSVGPALLWTPAVVGAHTCVLLARAFGSAVSADGFSLPYRLAMALTTVALGFTGLLVSFRVAQRFVEGRCALLATVAVWGGSSLAVYMYFNPSWSHAQSAFAVALFFWYWFVTLQDRSISQWLLLGALAGLMIDVYFVNSVILMLLLPEVISSYLAVGRHSSGRGFWTLVGRHALFGITVLVCLLPTFASRYIIYGSPFASGYIPVHRWFWKSPYFAQVLFSSDHGLFAWTPLLALSIAGLFLFWRRHPLIGGPVILAVLTFYFVIASYPDWDGISSFGNRFFVSLTVFFVLGLAELLQRVAEHIRGRSFALIVAVLGCFVAWNLGLMYQWGAHLIPARGAVAWSEVAHNQFHAVPKQLSSQLTEYLFDRRQMMDRIEQHDIQQNKERRAVNPAN